MTVVMASAALEPGMATTMASAIRACRSPDQSKLTLSYQGESNSKSPLFFWLPSDLLVPKPMR